jgi:hypothetical protein
MMELVVSDQPDGMAMNESWQPGTVSLFGVFCITAYL